MKPHPKIRKTVKWSALVASLLLGTLWGLSTQWYFGVGFPPTRVYFLAGGLVVGEAYQRPQLMPTVTGFFAGPAPEAFGWGFRSMWGIPLWLALAPLLLVSMIAWWPDVFRKSGARTGRCPKCNYDRTGLATGAVCPECGSAPS